jgi:hypothetical protein
MMRTQEEMTIAERRKYIQKMWERYRKAEKKEKGVLLDEMEKVTGMHRKSLVRILNGRLSRKKREKERGKVYGVEVEDAVRIVARSLDYPCAERLKPSLVWMAEILENHHELKISVKAKERLATISVSTVKRILKRNGRSEPRIAYQKPMKKPTNHIRKKYPMKRIPWETVEVGHFEVDLVCHSGEITTGDYINTLQMVDVATGWCELEAVMGKSYKVMEDGFKCILVRLPFPILELHPDNGSEFFNNHLIRFWSDRIQGLELTRSRPYHKNDNRFVEENNHSLIRAYVGHARLDTLQQLETLRQLYQCLWLFHNFFQPVMRTKEKVFLDELRFRRIFDDAKPPLDRLVASGQLSGHTQSILLNWRNQINPVLLRAQIDELIDLLVSLPSNNGSNVVNVIHTLRKESQHSVTFSFEPVNPFR